MPGRNLAFLCHPYHRGGVTRWMLDMAIESAKQGLNVYFITVEPKKDFFSSGGKETIISLLAAEPNINVVSKRVGSFYEFGTQSFRAQIFVELLMNNVPHFTPVILSDDPAIWETSKILSGYYDFVGVIHSDEKTYYELAETYNKYISLFACVSGRITKRIKDICSNNCIATIPCGIPLAEYTDSIWHDNSTLNLVYLGRISEYPKRVTNLVKICTELSEINISFSLKIIGEGEDRLELEKKFNDAGLSEHVQFLGWLSRKDIESHLKNCDLLLLTSDFEGMPIAMMEALGSGCGVISTRVSGVEDYENSLLAENCLWVNNVGNTDEAVLKGNGFGLQDAKQSIEIVHDIRMSSPVGLQGEYHELLKVKR